MKDAQLAEKFGADAIGVLVGRVHRSKDLISPNAASVICQAVGPSITTVLVTHVEDTDEKLRLAQQVSTSAIQLHSDLPPTTIKNLVRQLFPGKIIAKVSVEGEHAVRHARKLY